MHRSTFHFVFFSRAKEIMSHIIDMLKHTVYIHDIYNVNLEASYMQIH
jgi:hypothetical protein